MKNSSVSKKIVVFLSLFALMLGSLQPLSRGATQVTALAAENDKAAGINVRYRTQEEIKEYIKKYGTMINTEVKYEEAPLLYSPYSAGKLTKGTLRSALKMINQLRYIAGISYNVKLKSSYNKMAQAVAVVNYANGGLSHYPNKPSGMGNELYEPGKAGSSMSNLGYGYSSINSAIALGFMEDGDISNISTLGHRRWILNPSMSATGFGYTGNVTAMYAFDTKNVYAKEFGVLWPAQNMPVEFFGNTHPWSISMGYKVDASQISVKLTRLADKKRWVFSREKAAGYFGVNNEYYGQQGCIIFRPDEINGYKAGDVFKVEVSGLKEPLSYHVVFFSLD